jgi:hypothetical protein
MCAVVFLFVAWWRARCRLVEIIGEAEGSLTILQE